MKIKIVIEAEYEPSNVAKEVYPDDLAQQWLLDYDLDVMVQEGTFDKVTAEKIS